MEDQRTTVRADAAGSHRPAHRAQELSGAAILLLCLAVGVLMLAAGAEPYVPAWGWAAMLLGCLSCCFIAASGLLTGALNLLVYAAGVLSSWAALATMPHLGMLTILLIVVAAVGSYTVPMPVVFAISVLNCAVIWAHLWAHGVSLVESSASAAFYLILHLAAVFSTFALRRESTLRAELEQKTAELETASVLLEDSAKTAERLRISRELHDLIGHHLTVLNLELESAKHREGEQVRPHIDQAAAVAKGLLGSVRTTVGELRAAGPGNLRTALRRVASAVQSLDIFVEVDQSVTVDEQQAEALLRTGQEIITNTVKHAEARELRISVTQDSEGVRLKGTNDGLAPRKVVPGHGLQGLRERVELLSGTLTVRPHPYFTVEVSLPQSVTEGAHR